MAELWRDIREALAPVRFIGAFRDKWVWLALSLGTLGLYFPASSMPPLWRLAFAAVTEELTYRVLIQSQLERWLPARWGFFTCGMVLTSALFALSHLPSQPPLMALLTFFPAVVFGVLWTRHRSLWLCASIHFWYNLVFFL